MLFHSWPSWIVEVHSLDAVHPFIFLLSSRGRDTIEGVVALHHTAVGLCLAGFYHLVLVVGDEKLEAVLQKRTEVRGQQDKWRRINWLDQKLCQLFLQFNLCTGPTVETLLAGQVSQHTSRGSCTHRLLILHLLDAQVLQWDDSSRLLVLNKHKKMSWCCTQRTTETKQSNSYSLWCTQSSTDSCPWGWTISSSRFLLVPLWSTELASERLGDRAETDEHRSTGSSSGQADRCMGRQTDDGSAGLFTLTICYTPWTNMRSPSPQVRSLFKISFKLFSK